MHGDPLPSALTADIALFCGDELSSHEQRQACVERLTAAKVSLSALVAVRASLIATAHTTRLTILTSGSRRVRIWAVDYCRKALSPATGRSSSWLKYLKLFPVSSPQAPDPPKG